MKSGPRTRRIGQQAAALVALFVAAVATVATSQAQPQARTTSPTATIQLDSNHALATQLFVIRVPAEATGGLSGVSVNFEIDDATATAGKPIPADQAIRLRVVQVAAESGATASQWTLGTTGGVSLPVSCESPGPCDRAFRLIATMTDQAISAEVKWHVETTLSWTGQAYPSGVTAQVRIDDPIAVAGPAPALDISTTPQQITLASDHPVVARVVQMHLKAISGGAGGVPTGTVEAVAIPVGQRAAVGWISTTRVFLIPNPVEASFSTATPAAAPPDSAPGARLLGAADDPFSGCVPGSDCLRTFLVVMSWIGGDDPTNEWQLVIHRSDVDRVLTEPAGTVTLETLSGGLEPLAGPPSRLHFEGDTTYGPGEGQQPDIPLRVRLIRDPGTAAAGPAAPYAERLPIPGSLHYTVNVVGTPPSHTDLMVNVSATVPGGGKQAVASVVGSGTATGTPFLVCGVDMDCPTLTFEGSISYPANLEAERISVHWTLDVDVYSYPGLKYVLEMGPTPLPSATPS